MTPINPATLAANLRAEGGRQNLSLRDLRAKFRAVGGAEGALANGHTGRLLNALTVGDPTPAEVTALAVALGVPESRLLVSREELEADNEHLRGQVSDLLGLLEFHWAEKDRDFGEWLRDEWKRVP